MYDYRINGDYAGYAQSSLEAACPGATAMFAAGCGGDINPLPRWREGLGESCGAMLSAAVQDVLDGRYGAMTPVTGPLGTGADEPLLSLLDPPGREALQAALQSPRAGRLGCGAAQRSSINSPCWSGTAHCGITARIPSASGASAPGSS